MESTTRPSISVIVPIFNAEKYIERCVNSLLSQTIEGLELIFIDDCSTDNSVKILNDIIRRKEGRKLSIQILSTNENSKQAAVRTMGMKIASGEYIANCDPDDWIDPNMYEIMYSKAKETNADIVTCRICYEEANGKRSIEGPLPDGNGKDVLKGQDINHSLCNKIISTDLIHKYNIYPFKGINYGEDCNTIIRASFYAKHIASVSDAFYHYDRTNDTSITKKPCIWFLENYGYKNIALIEDFFRDNDAYDEFKGVIDELKYTYKSPLLYSAYKDGAIWCNIFPEIHSEIRNFRLPKAFRLTLGLIANHPILVKLFSKYITRKTN